MNIRSVLDSSDLRNTNELRLLFSRKVLIFDTLFSIKLLASNSMGPPF